MDGHAFLEETDALFLSLEEKLDQLDLDYHRQGAVLEIEKENGEKIVFNRHEPTQELWLASRAGGFHFRKEAGVWTDTRDQATLSARFNQLLGVALF